MIVVEKKLYYLKINLNVKSVKEDKMSIESIKHFNDLKEYLESLKYTDEEINLVFKGYFEGYCFGFAEAKKVI